MTAKTRKEIEPCIYGDPQTDCLDCFPGSKLERRLTNMKTPKTQTLVDTFDKYVKSDMERKDNIAAMRLEIVRAVNNYERLSESHEELLEALKEILNSTDCNLDEQSDETSRAMKKAYKIIAKAEEKANG